ncbi:unnamed protein product, partial [Brenthis ino]
MRRVLGNAKVPVLSLDHNVNVNATTTKDSLKFLPFIMLINPKKDTSEYWRETEILSLVKNNDVNIDYEKCEKSPEKGLVHFPSTRTVRPICRTTYDYQLCPQCPRFNNYTECELFRDSCTERKVLPSEYRTYCDKKYGKWRTMFIPADFKSCRCCDECVFYRDFRAGCNPYWGHPEQEKRALRCDKILRRFDLESPLISQEVDGECFQRLIVKDIKFSRLELNQKCAEFKKTIHYVNGTKEIEVEEEFLEPGCDDGLVCRQGICQDIHAVPAPAGMRRKRDEGILEAYEPCKRELKYFKKKYGKDGHLHYNAPQCTPLWLYAPVQKDICISRHMFVSQCRRFVCYCALEDGTFIQGIKVPRVEVSNMNCDCVREKCRTGLDIECDGYGNYKQAIFASHDYERQRIENLQQGQTSPASDLKLKRTGFEAALPTQSML